MVTTMFIDIGDNRHINAEDVSSLSWDYRTYANAGPDSTLKITMKNGTVYQVKHDRHSFGGVDAYKIEREILTRGRSSE